MTTKSAATGPITSESNKDVPHQDSKAKKLSQETKEFSHKWMALKLKSDEDPYHPKSWIDRAELCLGTLNELVCADALKAHMLCDDYVRAMLPREKKLPKLSNRDLTMFRDTACWVLYLALRELGASDDASEYFDQIPAALLMPNRMPAGIKMESWLQKATPLLPRQRYPFMNKPKRDNLSVFQATLDKFQLKIDKASFSHDVDVKGLYTRKDIQAGRLILTDQGVKVALDGKDTDETPPMVFLRYILEEMIKWMDAGADQNSDPTNAVGAKTLTVHYTTTPESFSFQHLVKQVALLLLKRDKLFHPKFESCLWFKLYWKFCTNDFEHVIEETKQHVVGIAPLYSFLNHSCEPNASCLPKLDNASDKPDSLIMEIKALADIRTNQEIFISYITPKDLKRPVHERREMLKEWFGSDCMCSRCQKEAKIAAGVASAKAVPTGEALSRLEGVSGRTSKKKRSVAEVEEDEVDDGLPLKRSRTTTR